MDGPLQSQSALIVIGEGNSRAAAAPEAEICSCCLQVFCSRRSIKFPTKQLGSFRVVWSDLCAASIVQCIWMRRIEARGLWIVYNVSSRMCSQSAGAPKHHNICSSPQSNRFSSESRSTSDKLRNCTVQSSALRLLGRAIISTLASLVTDQPQLLYLPEVTRFCFFLYSCFFLSKRDISKTQERHYILSHTKKTNLECSFNARLRCAVQAWTLSLWLWHSWLVSCTLTCCHDKPFLLLSVDVLCAIMPSITY